MLDAKTVRGEADYELLRQVILSGVVAYENDNYTQVSRTDNIVSAGASVKYLMNRYVSLVGEYTYSDRRSNLNGFNFDRHQIGVALTLAY